MPPDISISPVISGYRWLRAGRDLWRQRYNPQTRGFQSVAGWRLATRELAVAMFERMGYYGGEEEMRKKLEDAEGREKILKFPAAG